MEDRQAGGSRAFPVALGIVADVQRLVRPRSAQAQRPPVNFCIGFVGPQLARKKNMREKFRDSEVFQDDAETAVKI